jgi:hypothetical protein
MPEDPQVHISALTAFGLAHTGAVLSLFAGHRDPATMGEMVADQGFSHDQDLTYPTADLLENVERIVAIVYEVNAVPVGSNG